ncbi:phage head spike fiber domain-containing protein [Malikia spinosa]|nr:hypothetical protein [Malikia spinosa]
MAIASNFPAIRPSLNLDFANAKALDPRISFSRASAATYYDGKTVAKAEENLLLRSQEFTSTAWTKLGASIAQVNLVAPDATATASSLTEDSSNAQHYFTQSCTTSAGLPYTFSIYCKAGGRNFGAIYLSVSTFPVGATVFFDLSSGVITSTGAGVSASSIQGVGNGWFRVSISAVGTASGTGIAAVYLSNSDSSTAAYQGDGSSGIYIWGAQLEQRSQVTAYTPTTTQPITNYIPVLQTAQAGVPRFDHNSVTGESLGLLVEEQRTNLLFRSEEFSNSIWAKFNTNVEQNVAIAPDGTLTADKLFESSTALVVHGLDQAITTSANTYSASIYAKAAGRTKFRLSSNSGQSPAAEFDLTSNTAIPIGSTSSATITPVGNGWFRCTATRTVAGGAEAFQIQLMSAASTAYIGDGYSGIYIWGAQLEAGDKATSYIKTEASQVTRAADQNLTAALGQPGAGTIYVDATVRSGNTLATSGATTFPATASTRQKTAVAYDATSTRKSINGAAVTSSAGTQGGSNISIAPGATGWISKLSIYPQKFGDAHLQSLTA